MKLYEVCLIRVIPDIFENKTFYISSKHKNLRQPTERPTAQVGWKVCFALSRNKRNILKKTVTWEFEENAEREKTVQLEGPKVTAEI